MHILLTEILPSRVIIIIHLQKSPTKVSPPSNGKCSKIHGARRESWARDLYRGRMGKLNNLENASSLSLNFPHPSSTHWHSSWFPRHRINTHTFNSFLNTRNTPICPYSPAKNPSSFFSGFPFFSGIDFPQCEGCWGFEYSIPLQSDSRAIKSKSEHHPRISLCAPSLFALKMRGMRVKYSANTRVLIPVTLHPHPEIGMNNAKAGGRIRWKSFGI